MRVGNHSLESGDPSQDAVRRIAGKNGDPSEYRTAHAIANDEDFRDDIGRRQRLRSTSLFDESNH
jgi:hypothetical protein